MGRIVCVCVFVCVCVGKPWAKRIIQPPLLHLNIQWKWRKVFKKSYSCVILRNSFLSFYHLSLSPSLSPSLPPSLSSFFLFCFLGWFFFLPFRIHHFLFASLSFHCACRCCCSKSHHIARPLTIVEEYFFFCLIVYFENFARVSNFLCRNLSAILPPLKMCVCVCVWDVESCDADTDAEA